MLARWLLITISLLIALPLGGVGTLPARIARAGDDDQTPQVDGFLETRRYTDAATREVLGQFSYVVGEVDGFPGDPTPKQVKDTFLRKRLLDLRLMMDFNAFAYDNGSNDRYRDLVDVAYEAVGQFKDLFDTQSIDGFPIDQSERDRRLNDMNNGVAPFRQADVREKLEKAFDRHASQIVVLDDSEVPTIWQVAGIQPTDALDSAGNAARLGQAVLLNLRGSNLTVQDIFDPGQEARFHDVRKAMRSVMVLVDMFPSLSQAVADVREPLADVVDAYGKANDQVVAYHAAQASGRDLDARAAGLTKAFKKAQDLAQKFDEGGKLDAYVTALSVAQAAHVRSS